jgi:hypothetical protein
MDARLTQSNVWVVGLGTGRVRNRQDRTIAEGGLPITTNQTMAPKMIRTAIRLLQRRSAAL